MNYADTHIGLRIVVIANRSYPDTYVGRTGVITARYDGIDSDHGTVEVNLDNERGPTHMGVDHPRSSIRSVPLLPYYCAAFALGRFVNVQDV